MIKMVFHYQEKRNIFFTLIIGLIFYLVFTKAFFVTGFDAYGIGDMLINYECGFVRRGLLGTFFIKFHNLTNINIVKLIDLSTYFVYLTIIFLIGSKFLSRPFLFLFVVLSPIGFFFIINHWLAFAKKDVYILLFFVFCLYSFYIKKYWLRWLTLILLMVIGVLVHEGFIFFSMPYIFLFYEIKFNNQKQNILNVKSDLLKLIPLLLITGLLTIIIFYFSSTVDLNSKAICLQSQYSKLLVKNNMDENSREWAYYAIGWLNSDLHRGINETSLNYKDPIFFKAALLDVIYFMLATICFIVLSTGNFNFLRVPLKYPISFAFLIVGLNLMFYIAIDWGRWMHLAFMHLVIFISVVAKPIWNQIYLTSIRKPILLGLVIISIGIFNTVPVFYRLDSIELKSFGGRVAFKCINFLR
jgi:hypothetical protein